MRGGRARWVRVRVQKLQFDKDEAARLAGKGMREDTGEQERSWVSEEGQG